MSDTDWWKARVKGKEGQVLRDLRDKRRTGANRKELDQHWESIHHDHQVPSNYLETTAHDGSTSPLHDAAKRGNMELLRECLLNKMPVNQGDAAGQ